MSRYYYAVSTLSMLSIDSPPQDIESFLEFLKGRCSGSDYDLLLSAFLVPHPEKRSKNSVLREWQDWEAALRNSLTLARAPVLDADPAEHLRGMEPPGGSRTELYEVEPAVQESMSGNNPKAVEESLDRKRWGKLDELENGHFFDIEKLIIYYLKLQLLERKNKFTRDRGKENFNEIYQAITESIEDFPNRNVIE
ncbi:MAG: DUF2764 family protein [Spirochaetia bacterium]